MITLEALLNEFKGKTIIQQNEYLKKFIGMEVQVLGEIAGINDVTLTLENIAGLPQLMSIPIYHRGDQLHEQLLEYHYGDGVRLTTRLTGADFEASYPTPYSLNLLSIRKLSTREAREQIASIQNEINDLQSKVDSNNSELRESWIMLGGGILIWALALIVGIACSPANGFIEVILVLLSALVIYVGGAGLAIAIVVVIIQSISIRAKVSSLKSGISNGQQAIRKLDAYNKGLNNGG